MDYGKKNTDHRNERINWNEINIPRVPLGLLYNRPLKLATKLRIGTRAAATIYQMGVARAALVLLFTNVYKHI